jgi:hypothetical protein
MSRQIEKLKAEKTRFEGKLEDLVDQIEKAQSLVDIADREAGSAVLGGQDPDKVKGNLDQLENRLKMLSAARQAAIEKIGQLNNDLAEANREAAEKRAVELRELSRVKVKEITAGYKNLLRIGADLQVLINESRNIGNVYGIPPKSPILGGEANSALIETAKIMLARIHTLFPDVYNEVMNG